MSHLVPPFTRYRGGWISNDGGLNAYHESDFVNNKFCRVHGPRSYVHRDCLSCMVNSIIPPTPKECIEIITRHINIIIDAVEKHGKDPFDNIFFYDKTNKVHEGYMSREGLLNSQWISWAFEMIILYAEATYPRDGGNRPMYGSLEEKFSPKCCDVYYAINDIIACIELYYTGQLYISSPYQLDRKRVDRNIHKLETVMKYIQKLSNILDITQDIKQDEDPKVLKRIRELEEKINYLENGIKTEKLIQQDLENQMKKIKKTIDRSEERQCNEIAAIICKVEIKDDEWIKVKEEDVHEKGIKKEQ